MEPPTHPQNANHYIHEAERIAQDMKRNVVYGAYQSSEPILHLLSQLVTRGDYSSSAELMRLLHVIGRTLQEGRETEFAATNIVRHLMFLVREAEKEVFEPEVSRKAADSFLQTAELHRLINRPAPTGIPDVEKFRHALADAFLSYQQEFQLLYAAIADQGDTYINDNDFVLVYGKSRTVLELLLGASKKRRFAVVVVETNQPTDASLVRRLDEHHVEVHCLAESSLFTVLPRINKVILGCHAVLANGGLIATAGSFHICNAAAHFHIPVYVCTGTYKICPTFPNNSLAFSLIRSPLGIIPPAIQTPTVDTQKTGLDIVFESPTQPQSETNDRSPQPDPQSPPSELLSPQPQLSPQSPMQNDLKAEQKPFLRQVSNIRILNPTYDYIQPEWISLFITNEKAVSPSYIYRLLAQLYNPDDSFID